MLAWLVTPKFSGLHIYVPLMFQFALEGENPVEHDLYKSPARRAFLHYLRTGQRLSEYHFVDREEFELKFNPYHDPHNGQFTFAPGGPKSLSHVIVSSRRSHAAVG